MQPQKIEALKKIRDKDPSKLTPDTESLNPERVRGYLEDKNITAENFDDKFNLESALDILRIKGTSGEKAMEEELVKTKDYLDGLVEEKRDSHVYGDAGVIWLSDLLEDANEKSFRSTLNKELMRVGDEDKEAEIMSAYRKYHALRRLAKRSLIVKEKFKEDREDEKASVTAGLKEDFSGVVKKAQKNWKKMDTTEKAITAGLLLVGAIWLSRSSDNQMIKTIKEYAWSAVKWTGLAAGGVYLASKLYKLGSDKGEEGLDAFNNWIGNTTGRSGFWKETFDTTTERADALQKSTVFMAEEKFSHVSKLYQEAKNKNKKTIDVSQLKTVDKSDMKGDEAFAAMDSFFSRYPVSQLNKRYDKADWLEVVSLEMAEDETIKMDDGLVEATAREVREKGIRMWNWLMVGEGLGVMRRMYKWVWGVDAENDEEVREFVRENFADDLDNSGELDGFVVRKFDGKEEENYGKLLTSGTTPAGASDIKMLEVPGDSLYLMITREMPDTMTNKKAGQEAILGARKTAEEFFEKRFPNLKGKAKKFMLGPHGVRVVQDSSYRYFVRVPLEGSTEFEQLRVGTLTAKDIDELSASGEKVFNKETRFHYVDLLKETPWKAEQLRIRFLLDSSQTKELEAICQWFNYEYKSDNKYTVDQVWEIMMTDDEVRDKALRQATWEDTVNGVQVKKKVEQKLAPNAALLKKLEEGTLLEDGIEDIENDAVAGFEGSQEARNALLEKLRRDNGYQIRLAILGDRAARTATKFNKYEKIKIEFMDEVIPFNGKSFLEAYKKWCEDLIEIKNKAQ